MRNPILVAFAADARAYFDRCGAGAASPDFLRLTVYQQLAARHTMPRVAHHLDRLSPILQAVEQQARDSAPCKPIVTK